MIVGILAIRLTGRGIEGFELLGLEFLVGYRTGGTFAHPLL